jgi:hypothetical protein
MHGIATCKECGKAVSEKYCSRCGQKTSITRIDLKMIAIQIIEVTYHFTERTVFTMYELFLRPGKTVQAYLHGKRKTYQSPVALFTLSYGLLYLTAWSLKRLDVDVFPATLTALQKPTLLATMVAIGLGVHYLVLGRKLYVGETFAIVMYVYASVCVFAMPVVLIASSNTDRLSAFFGQLGFLAIDGPANVFIAVQFYRVAPFFGVSRLKYLIGVLTGLTVFLAMRFLFGFG